MLVGLEFKVFCSGCLCLVFNQSGEAARPYTVDRVGRDVVERLVFHLLARHVHVYRGLLEAARVQPVFAECSLVHPSLFALKIKAVQIFRSEVRCPEDLAHQTIDLAVRLESRASIDPMDKTKDRRAEERMEPVRGLADGASKCKEGIVVLHVDGDVRQDMRRVNAAVRGYLRVEVAGRYASVPAKYAKPIGDGVACLGHGLWRRCGFWERWGNRCTKLRSGRAGCEKMCKGLEPCVVRPKTRHRILEGLGNTANASKPAN